MITGEIKSQVDKVWDSFWTGGISNPLEVIEQITYLLFIKRLDELEIAKERRAKRTGQPVAAPTFSPEQQHLRWHIFKEMGDARAQYMVIADAVFPFLKTLGDEQSAFSKHMQDARFGLSIEKAGLVAKVVDLLDAIPMADRDTKGDLYEYLLSKLSTSGTNGQFRTPRHIIRMMVQMMQPKPTDIICDPACGTAGFLVASAEYLIDHHSAAIYGEHKAQFNGAMFQGFDFDATMLRIAAMNMILHGVNAPDIREQLSGSISTLPDKLSCS